MFKHSDKIGPITITVVASIVATLLIFGAAISMALVNHTHKVAHTVQENTLEQEMDGGEEEVFSKYQLESFVDACIYIGGQTDSERYLIARDLLSNDNFVRDYEVFERELKKLENDRDFFIKSICSSGFAFAVTGVDKKNGKVLLGGMFRFYTASRPQDEELIIYEFEHKNIYNLMLLGSAEFILTYWAPDDRIPCQEKQEYLFDLEDKSLRKFRDCGGCSDVQDNESHECSLDVFESAELVLSN